MAHESHGVSCQ